MFKMAERSALLRAKIDPTVAAFRLATAKRWSPAPRGKSDRLELGGYARGRWGDGWYWVFESLGVRREAEQEEGKEAALGRARQQLWPATSRRRAASSLSLTLAGVDRGRSRSPRLSCFSVFRKPEGASAPFLIYYLFFFCFSSLSH